MMWALKLLLLFILGADVSRVKKDEDGYLTRQYTPISKPDQQGKFSVVVKVCGLQ